MEMVYSHFLSQTDCLKKLKYENTKKKYSMWLVMYCN